MGKQRTSSDFWVDLIVPVGVLAVLAMALTSIFLHWQELPPASGLLVLKKMTTGDAKVTDASTLP
jgi:hypothetical protein